jgi:hypothetical protein
MILPVVLYGCETWSLTVREEHKLRVCENRVLRRIIVPKRDGVMGGCKAEEAAVGDADGKQTDTGTFTAISRHYPSRN